jgi:hypothetical protein
MLFRQGFFGKVFPTDIPPNYAKKKSEERKKLQVAYTGS